MAPRIAFDWDKENRRHLQRHKVAPEEFEEVMFNEPADLEYEYELGEDRYKVLGVTNRGRILVVIWTPRGDRIRAVTAYPAPAHLRRTWAEYWEERSR